MTKTELIKTIEKCPEDIDIAMNINGLIYDITDCCLAVDMDTNKTYIKLGNKENEDKYRENRFNKYNNFQYKVEPEEIERIKNVLEEYEKQHTK